jgi:hypothetical protein
MKRPVILSRWAFLRAGSGICLAGAEDGEHWRVSSSVMDFDPAGMEAITSSGQRYRLEGDAEPGYAMSAWLRARLSEAWDADVVDIETAAREIEASRRAYIEALKEANPALRDLIVDDPDDDDDEPKGRKP